MAAFTMSTAAGTGTVSISAGSTTVTGVGTNFTANDVGLVLNITGATYPAIIASYTSATQVTLRFSVSSGAISGASFTYNNQFTLAASTTYTDDDIALTATAYPYNCTFTDGGAVFNIPVSLSSNSVLTINDNSDLIFTTLPSRNPPRLIIPSGAVVNFGYSGGLVQSGNSSYNNIFGSFSGKNVTFTSYANVNSCRIDFPNSSLTPVPTTLDKVNIVAGSNTSVTGAYLYTFMEKMYNATNVTLVNNLRSTGVTWIIQFDQGTYTNVVFPNPTSNYSVASSVLIYACREGGSTTLVKPTFPGTSYKFSQTGSVANAYFIDEIWPDNGTPGTLSNGGSTGNDVTVYRQFTWYPGTYYTAGGWNVYMTDSQSTPTVVQNGVVTSSAGLLLTWQQWIRGPQTTTNYGPFKQLARKPGYQSIYKTFTPTAPVTESFLPVTDTYYTSSQSGLSGVSVSGTTLTVANNVTVDQLHDWFKYWMALPAQMAAYPTIADIDSVTGSQWTLPSGWSIVLSSGYSIATGSKLSGVNVPTITTSSALNNIAITSNVTQATPTNLTGLVLTGNLTFNTNSNVTITLTNCTISGTISNSGSGTVTVRNNNSTIGTVGTNISAALVATLSVTMPSGTAIYVANGSGVQQAYVVSSGSTYTLDVTGGTGSWAVKLAYYGDISQTFTFTPSSGGTFSYSPTLLPDSKITQSNASIVAAYTTFTNVDQLYDYAAYWETTNTGIPYSREESSQGVTDSFGVNNVVFNATASSAWSYSGGTITVNSTTIGPGSTFTAISTTGLITFLNGASATCIYTDSQGTSTNFVLTGLASGSSVWVADNNNNTVTYLTNQSGTVTTYIPPGASGTWQYAVENYGNQRQANTFTPNGTVITVNVKVLTDIGITNTSQSSVAAYTTITTADQLYDYTAYYRLTTPGITYGQITTRSGTQILIGSYSLVVNQSASAVMAISGSTITIHSISLAAGTTFNTIVATPPATITPATNEVITVQIQDANGNSSVTIQGGTGNFTLWKLIATAPPANYATGTNLGNVGNITYRFLSAPTYQLIVVDNGTGYYYSVSMAQGYYTAALFFGAQVQLAQSATVTTINTNVNVLLAEVAAIQGTGFVANQNSLTNITNNTNLIPALL